MNTDRTDQKSNSTDSFLIRAIRVHPWLLPQLFMTELSPQ
ncbi:hypothetical protein FRUB_00509 [Fimbriiglobus ruber]|uniref:Uncharacterized protein n=1 Tax=Fimbriiglobus ruber TaxID=1908690 RepID=A0A225DZ70_9BACT|nr:hypothetical protein FRUB_00509 [Fimbriiglobus ruber]